MGKVLDIQDTRDYDLGMRYHLFSGYTYYPCRGLGDYVGSFDSLEEAQAQSQSHHDWDCILFQNTEGNLEQVV